MIKPIRTLWALGALALLALAACSLAEDITPPPGIELTQAASIPTPAFAAFRPNPVAGEVVYSLHCIQCHGPQGKGDGEMAPQLAAQRSGPLPDFSDPSTLHSQAPQKIYITVTNGRLDLFMPPFNNELTAAERWNAIAYLYSLARPESELAQGQAVYAEQCAACHGPAGQSATAGDLSAPDFFSATSNEALLTALSSEAHAALSGLSDADKQAASAYVRTLAFDLSQPAAALTPTPAPNATATVSETATPQVSAGVTVEGLVTNGSGGEVPDDLRVQLHIFDQFQMVDTLSTTVSNGAYAFANVPLLLNQVALVTTEYGSMRYGSDIATYTGAETTLTLPLEIYDTTSDTSVLSIGRWHVVFSVPTNGQVEVTELLIFNNASNRVFVSASDADPAVTVALPAGAVNLQFQEGSPTDQIQFTDEGFGFSGALRPGVEALSLFFSFDMPLSGAQEFSQSPRYPVEALNVLLPEGSFRLTAPDLSGPQTQSMEGGATYQIYTSAQWPADKPVTFTLAASTGSAANALTENWRWWLGGLGAALLLAAGVWWLRQRGAGASIDVSARRAEIIDELAELDEGFEKGEYDEREYQQQRAALKAEALDLARRLEKG